MSYSTIFLKSASGISGYILAPLAVSPEHQKQGVGVLRVYGDPDYYGRFGFKREIGRFFVPPYTLKYPFGWTGMKLNATATPNTPIKFECVAALSKPDLW